MIILWISFHVPATWSVLFWSYYYILSWFEWFVFVCRSNILHESIFVLNLLLLSIYDWLLIWYIFQTLKTNFHSFLFHKFVWFYAFFATFYKFCDVLNASLVFKVAMESSILALFDIPYLLLTKVGLGLNSKVINMKGVIIWNIKIMVWGGHLVEDLTWHNFSCWLLLRHLGILLNQDTWSLHISLNFDIARRWFDVDHEFLVFSIALAGFYLSFKLHFL